MNFKFQSLLLLNLLGLDLQIGAGKRAHQYTSPSKIAGVFVFKEDVLGEDQ